ncbi:Lipocalin-like domain-containing protein [Sporobacter termitidis DSM 10068]|uniref:Lipocalin-like domain-containing protein n=1 Tax=Sporobacter termitidis DSM 10068 TaxID=1123282 RepID=A0A1M5ZER6_9FIRM|nr:lipocalin-like domain-containing protein [Sporobacter termitidis]SHI22642.1 Lipocalin-like domain-containing protein [Sporobacter termitidis DSM 10068]
MLKEKLLGTWKLASFTGTDEDGGTVHIMGEDATGFICYSQDGWVSVQILRANRPRYSVPDTELGTDEQTLAAARGMFAYAGRFTVDEENQIVYHALEFSLIPNWIGSTQKRYVRFEDDGALVLTADPVRIGKDGKRRHTALRWVRG